MKTERRLRNSMGAVLPLVCMFAAASCSSAIVTRPAVQPTPAPLAHSLIPMPAPVNLVQDDSFAITAGMIIAVDSGLIEPD